MAEIEKLDGKTMDIVEQNIEQLKELFPSVFSEGKVQFNKLEELLGNYVVDDEDHYNFTWHGKRKAGRLAQTPSTGTLRPAKDESVDWDNTENLFIEGDNLEVLKLLQKSYHQQVKMIYIDPPYNTGTDFVYEDNFIDGVKNYLEMTGQVDGKGKKLGTNSGSIGRYHTNWLNMMYPRLKLARNLLRDDGVIFISIDDNEQANLKKLCDEVFGEENFLGCAGRITKKSNNKGDFWAPNFDYLLTYAKSAKSTTKFFGGVNYDAYNLIEEEGPLKGEKYQLVRMYMSSLENRNPEQRFFITCPDGSKVIPPGSTLPPERPNLGDGIWRWTRSKMEKEAERIVIKEVKSSNLITEDGSAAKWNVYTKTYLSEVIANASAKPNSIVEDHINQIGSHEINALDIPFDFSKPSTLIQYLIEISRSDKDSIILDFFAGSGTTAQAVMNANLKDNGNRKALLVQLPETIDEKHSAYKSGYRSIADISKERIRRAAKKLKEKTPDYNGDLGFKVFKLDSSNIKRWDADFDTLESDLMDAVDYLVKDRTDEDVLYELCLKLGLDLSIKIEEKTIAGKKLFILGRGYLVVCLDDAITMDLVNGIGALKDELAPEDGMRVVFKDGGFKDDVVKTNALQTLKRFGIDDIKSL